MTTKIAVVDDLISCGKVRLPGAGGTYPGIVDGEHHAQTRRARFSASIRGDLPSMGSARVVALLCVIAFASCAQYPKDPAGTLERVRGGTMRVGYTVNRPWTMDASAPPGGVEATLIERFARRLDARVEWIEASEQELFAALHVRELDVVIGGLVSTNPSSGEGTFTHPYITTRVVVAVPSGQSVPDDISGMQVAVEEGTEAAGILAKTDAIPVRVGSVDDGDRPAAVDDWLLDELGMQSTGVVLIESDHVMAVPHGENAWLTELERFLLENRGAARTLLEQVEP